MSGWEPQNEADLFWKGGSEQLRRMRQLMQALMFSGGLNILLLIYIVYGFMGDKPPIPYCELKPADPRSLVVDDFTNAEAIRCFKQLTLEQLAAKLQNSQLIEEGYSQRDLALGCLVTYHHFDLKRALQGLPAPIQQRQLAVRGAQSEEIIVYPGLTAEQWQAIVQFSQTERWPLTARGMFELLRKPGMSSEKTLCDAFYLSSEFLAIETLLNRGDCPVAKQEILELLLAGDWNILMQFALQQRTAQDLSPARRQRLLVEYITKSQSKAAAKLLLKTDKLFVAKKLDDNQVLLMLEFLDEKSADSCWLGQELLTSPRGNAVWQAAANRLYQYAGEAPPQPYDHKAALARFVPEKMLREKLQGIVAAPINPTPAAPAVPVAAEKPPAPAKPEKEVAEVVPKASRPSRSATARLHTVQKGDTLWRISRKYNTSVDSLRKHNQLESDSLKPGTTIRIP